MDLKVNDKKVEGLSCDKINFIFGKNGSGKSRLLQGLDKEYRNNKNKDEFHSLKYVSPERGSDLKKQSNIEQRMVNDENYEYRSRRKNYNGEFRSQTMVNFFALRNKVRKQIDDKKDDPEKLAKLPSFNGYVDRINGLLDEIEIVEDARKGFVVKSDSVSIENISSGEKELITNAIEILLFFFEANEEPEKSSLLLLDEPDVHLHPDLQSRLIRLLVGELGDSKNAYVIIATHSAALLSATPKSKIALMKTDASKVEFQDLDEKQQKILPVFGAHLISGIFNSQTLFLVEGIDDQEVWSLVSRSVGLDLYPTEVGGRPEMDDYENRANEIAETLYENPLIYSLRDRDEDESEDIEDKGCVCRFKTSCRNIDNLLISKQALGEIDTSWESLKDDITNWLGRTENKRHDKYTQINEWRQEDFPRKDANIKPFISQLLEISDSQYSWKVVVVNAISNNQIEANQLLAQTNSIFSYLGEKITKQFFTQNET